MAYIDGHLNFDTSIDTAGFQQDTKKLNTLVKGLGIFKILEKGFQAVAGSVDSAVARYDTLQKFPKVLQQMGYNADEAQEATTKLSEGIQGLPTKLDDVVSTAQRITVLTGNLDGSVKATIALNNAFLASGSSSADAGRGLTQYVQMLSSGKVDMMSWRTLQETMGLALNKTAQAFGFAGSSAQNYLYAALRDGNITFDEFNAKIIELNEGVGGFADLAQVSSSGIATAWTNLQTAIVRETAAIIQAIDEGLSETRFQNIETIISTMKDGIIYALGLVGNAFGFMAENIEIIIPIAAGLLTIINLFKFASSKTAAEIMKQATATAVSTTATTADTIAKGAQTVAATASGAATGKLTLKMLAQAAAAKIAAAATAAWNVVAAAGPFILVTAAIVGVVAATIALVAWTNKNIKATNEERKSIVSLTEARMDQEKRVKQDAEAARELAEARETETLTNRELVASLYELSAANDVSNRNNEDIIATVDALNAAYKGLGLSYDETSQKLNMVQTELDKYIEAINTVNAAEEARTHNNNLAEERRIAQEALNVVIARRTELEQGLLEAEKEGYVYEAGRNLTAQGYRDELSRVNIEIEAQNTLLSGLNNTMQETADTELEAAQITIKATQIRNNQMDQVREYAPIGGVAVV